jgi:hypothetical protein
MSNWNAINPFPNGVAKVGAGSNVSITGTTAYPIVNASASGVASISAGSNVSITGTATNPIVNAAAGANAPVFVNNWLGTIEKYYMTKNKTYFVLNQNVYYLTLQLPTSNNVDGDWYDIVPMNQAGLGKLTLGYTASGGLQMANGSRYHVIFYSGVWWISSYTAGSFFQLTPY